MTDLRIFWPGKGKHNHSYCWTWWICLSTLCQKANHRQSFWWLENCALENCGSGLPTKTLLYIILLYMNFEMDE